MESLSQRPTDKEEEELVRLNTQKAQSIEDVDIRECSDSKLRFRKMPWHELAGFLVFALIAIVCIVMRFQLP